MSRMLFWLVLLAAVSGCEPRAAVWTRSELYFGLSTPSGGQVSEEEWQRFLVEVVTPRFPDGLTILDAAGQYRNQKGELIRERSKVLLIARKTGWEEDRKLEDIRRVYRERFGQESVLRVDVPAAADF